MISTFHDNSTYTGTSAGEECYFTKFVIRERFAIKTPRELCGRRSVSNTKTYMDVDRELTSRSQRDKPSGLVPQIRTFNRQIVKRGPDPFTTQPLPPHPLPQHTGPRFASLRKGTYVVA
ncbi:hypothetical protein EVAR_7509_1 [Eumeta japonica]|uniref:Uncharacterized protein n=1 Tax=Eumeta variegata TaxID=151549 RepID=A0A4C1Y5X6_EUMVA|nr:hypothetical protein EVAR_7509_1 [Eumeta japonica]